MIATVPKVTHMQRFMNSAEILNDVEIRFSFLTDKFGMEKSRGRNFVKYRLNDVSVGFVYNEYDKEMTINYCHKNTAANLWILLHGLEGKEPEIKELCLTSGEYYDSKVETVEILLSRHATELLNYSSDVQKVIEDTKRKSLAFQDKQQDKNLRIRAEDSIYIGDYMGAYEALSSIKRKTAYDVRKLALLKKLIKNR